MSLLDDVKIACRVTGNDFDPELNGLISAAQADMCRVGISKQLWTTPEQNGLSRHAIVLYVKAHFGYDNAERPQFEKSYRQIVCDMMNSGMVEKQ